MFRVQDDITHIGKRAKRHRDHLSSSERNGVSGHHDRHKQFNALFGWHSIPFNRVAGVSQLLAAFFEQISDVAEYVHVENNRDECEEIHKNLYE